MGHPNRWTLSKRDSISTSEAHQIHQQIMAKVLGEAGEGHCNIQSGVSRWLPFQTTPKGNLQRSRGSVVPCFEVNANHCNTAVQVHLPVHGELSPPPRQVFVEHDIWDVTPMSSPNMIKNIVSNCACNKVALHQFAFAVSQSVVMWFHPKCLWTLAQGNPPVEIQPPYNAILEHANRYLRPFSQVSATYCYFPSPPLP